MIDPHSVPSMMSENKIKSNLFFGDRFFLLLLILIIASMQSVNSVDLQIDPGEAGSLEELYFLVLNGIIVSEEEFSSVALLQDSRTGENLILKTGESIGNFKLVRILENRIILQRDNDTFQLYLGRSGMFKPIKKEGIRPISDLEIQAEKAARQTTQETVITKEFSRSNLEKRILAEWKIILQQTEFSPHSVAGQPKGIKLTKIPEGSLLSEIGMQRDDIILELNGEELKDKSFIISLIDRFKNDDRGELTIERNGRLIRYEYVLK